MFRRHNQHYNRRGGGITGVFRLFLSLIIMAVLALGLYQAYKSFSGIDPSGADPKSIARSLVSSDSLSDLIGGILSFSPQTSLGAAKKLLKDEHSSPQPTTPTSNLAFKFAIVTDSHNDSANLAKALKQAKAAGAKLVIGLGDFTDVGTIAELQAAKEQFDASGLPYYVTAGDHDLWDSRDKKHPAAENFMQVFGSTFQSFSYDNTRFIIFYNSDNYLGLDDFQLKWLEDELDRISQGSPKLILAFTSIPLYHPSSDHVMGKVNSKLKNQADHLISIFSKKGIAEVFAGDTHFFSRYSEPTTNLKMTNVGAVTSIRNPQAPRFMMVDVFEDGNYNISDAEIK